MFVYLHLQTFTKFVKDVKRLSAKADKRSVNKVSCQFFVHVEMYSCLPSA